MGLIKISFFSKNNCFRHTLNWIVNLYLVIYDTEFTAWEGSMARKWSEPWEHRELLQLAALKVSISDQGCEVIDSFSRLIKPQRNSVLSPYVINLTGLTQQQIDSQGVNFPAAISDFADFCRKENVVTASWGNDHIVLKENADLHKIILSPVLSNHIDLSIPFRKITEFNFQVCSGKLHEQIGVNVEGQIHNALHDVKSIVVTLDHLISNQFITLEQLHAESKAMFFSSNYA